MLRKIQNTRNVNISLLESRQYTKCNTTEKSINPKSFNTKYYISPSLSHSPTIVMPFQRYYDIRREWGSKNRNSERRWKTPFTVLNVEVLSLSLPFLLSLPLCSIWALFAVLFSLLPSSVPHNPISLCFSPFTPHSHSFSCIFMVQY